VVAAEADSICGITSVTGGRPENRCLSRIIAIVREPMHNADIDAQKAVEFYAASVNAWYASALEHDKSIFALAGGGIAILVTLLTTVGFSSWLTFFLFAAAITFFLITLLALLTIFRKNQKYIETTLAKGQPHNDPNLRRLDLLALIAFGVGVLFASKVGISAALDSFTTKQTEKEKAMAIESKNRQSQQTPLRESVNGTGRLQPDLTKSFNGAGNLQPSASAPVAAPAASTMTAAPTAATPTTPAAVPASAPDVSKAAP